MNEKRFQYDTTDLNFDDEIEGLMSLFYDDDKQMTYAEVLDKLNELHEENVALKKFVKVNFSDMMAEKMEKELKND